MKTTNNPLVSICCITYNHEHYIRDAIESFLMQKTDFQFEILIHDDASTDKTADIIREYEQNYPTIFNPIYQTENQYSRGKNPLLLVFQAAKGKYIAICEGDDYWTDPLKLAKQIDEMEKHPDCYISFHPAKIRWVDKSKRDRIFGRHNNSVAIIPAKKVILGGGHFIPTMSIILRREVISQIISFFQIAKDAPIGDYYLQTVGSLHGGALYLPDIMSIYRQGDPQSWSERKKNNSNFQPIFYFAHINTLSILDCFTDYKYSYLFEQVRLNEQIKVMTSQYITIDDKKIILNAHLTEIPFFYRIIWKYFFQRPLIDIFIKKLRRIIARNYHNYMKRLEGVIP